MNSSTVLIAPGFADSNFLGTMFGIVFGENNSHSIPVPGHPNTNPNESQYWISAFGDEAINILQQTQPNLVVTNSIHTIETLSKIKELETAGYLNDICIASFAPAFDVVTAVVNMYNIRFNDNKAKEDILNGDISIYTNLMSLVKEGDGNFQEFCKDLNSYNETPELFFELVEYFGERIKILLNPNDRIIFSGDNNSIDQRIRALKPIEIEGRGKGNNNNRDAFLSHVVGKTVLSEILKLRTWID